MKKQTVLSVVLFMTIFALILFYFVPSDNDVGCQARKTFEAIRFEGVVINKYLDSTQHSVPIVEVKDMLTKDTVKANFFFELSDIYKVLIIGDTITKMNGSDEVFRIHRGQKQLIGTAYFKCR